MNITFLGAAGEVTGSQHLIETDRLRLLLDCGLFHGRRAEAYSKNAHFRCKPRDLDGVVLSHAHIDHCGNLPGLHRAGYRGPIFCTPATADVAEIMLRDSVHIQQEDARYLRRHLKRGHPPIEPLYSEHDVSQVVKQFETLDYDEWHELSRDLKVRFSDAGHILGSAICELSLRDRGDDRRVVYSGDLGRRGLPLLRDPTPVGGCDVLITESTYGNRLHPPADDIKSSLLRIVQSAVDSSGKVIIPAFSLGRTQQVVYYLNELFNEGRLPVVPVFVDSPLSRRLTWVYRRHKEIMDRDVCELLEHDDDPFGFQSLFYVASRDESVALNRREGPFVVISASGMCENGRVRHHLKNSVEDPRNTIVMIGYQAENTLGRRIVEGRPKIRIFDRDYRLRANVEVLDGLSAHADVHEFKWWFEQMASETGIGQAFVVHGEPEAATALAGMLRDYSDEEPIVPQQFESYEA